MELRDLEDVVYEVLGEVREDEVPLVVGLEVEGGLERELGGGRSLRVRREETSANATSSFFFRFRFRLCMRPLAAPCSSILSILSISERRNGSRVQIASWLLRLDEEARSGRRRKQRKTNRASVASSSSSSCNRRGASNSASSRTPLRLPSSPRRHSSRPGLRGRAGRPSPAFGRSVSKKKKAEEEKKRFSFRFF